MSYLYMSFTLYITTQRTYHTLHANTSHPTCVHYLNIDFAGGSEPPTTTPQTTSNTMKQKKALLIYNS